MAFFLSEGTKLCYQQLMQAEFDLDWVGLLAHRVLTTHGKKDWTWN